MEKKYSEILLSFKKQGCRITDQRRELLSIILENPGCSVKELYYIARKADAKIGRATVYRLVRSLEDMGYVSKRSVSIV